MTDGYLKTFWEQVLWPKPNLVELAKGKSPLGYALRILEPEILVQASSNLDPFGWLLAAVDMTEWTKYCRERRALSWMARIWLATASQLNAERTLIHKAHGWRDTWEKLLQSAKEKHVHVDASKLEQIHARLMQLGFHKADMGVYSHSNPTARVREVRFFYHKTDPQKRCLVSRFSQPFANADELFFAQLSHATKERRDKLLAMPELAERLAKARAEKDEAFLRRFRHAKRGEGTRAGVAVAEMFMVQFWLELPPGLPGLCFFSDSTLHRLLAAFGLAPGKESATKQARERLGLIQAGVKRHVIEHAIQSAGELRLTSSMLKTPYVLGAKLRFCWNTPREKRQLWPAKGVASNRDDAKEPDITPLLNERDHF